MRFFKICFGIIVITAALAGAQQKPTSQSGSDSARVQPGKNGSPGHSDEIESLRNDLSRMKALLQQMQTNLGFVDTSQSALKHQFQLEMQMWQTLIAHMERRLAEAPAR